MGRKTDIPKGKNQNEQASTAVSMSHPPAWEAGVRAEDAGDAPMGGMKPKVLVDAAGRAVPLNEEDPEIPRNYADELARREQERDLGRSPSGVGAVMAEEIPVPVPARAFASRPVESLEAAVFAGLSPQDLSRMGSPHFQKGVMNQVFGLLGLRLSRFPERIRQLVWERIESAVQAFVQDEEKALETCLRNLSSLSDGSWGPSKTMPMLVAMVGCSAALDVILEYSPLERV